MHSRAYGNVAGIVESTLTGWWYTYPSEKYESQWEILSHILWKIKMFETNHQ